MIILDIETTGLKPSIHSMVSLGAVDYNTGEEFYGECRIPDDAVIDPYSLGINGFTEAQCRDKTKPSPRELYLSFLEWSKGRTPLLAGQQVGSLDIPFIKAIAESNNLIWRFGYRSVDLHSLAYLRFRQSLSLDGILTTLGLEPEPKPHNALTGARVEYKAFKLLLG